MLPWKTAETFAPDIIRKLYGAAWLRSVLMNVNFPPVPPAEVKGIRVEPQGRRVEHTQITTVKDPAGRDMLWIGDFPTDDPEDPKTDLGAVLEGCSFQPFAPSATLDVMLWMRRSRKRASASFSSEAKRSIV